MVEGGEELGVLRSCPFTYLKIKLLSCVLNLNGLKRGGKHAEATQYHLRLYL
jgi:hypothetical protein